MYFELEKYAFEGMTWTVGMFSNAPLRSEAGKHTGVTFIIASLCEARLIRDAEVRDTGNYTAVEPGISREYC